MTRTSHPVKWVACALVLLVAPPARAQAPVLHAGIEIGGKGVKATVVEVPADPTKSPVTVKFTKTINTTISDFDAGKFRPKAIAETVEAITTLRTQIATDFRLNAATDITVVGSSGVALASNRGELAAAVEKATGKTLEYITVEREAELALKGLILLGGQPDALLIDIGGGNTKGGVFADGKFVPYGIPLGTVTFSNKVKAAAAGRPFAEAARALAADEVLKPLTAQAAPAMTDRKTVYAVGGVIWATATYAHPELADQPLVPLTAADVDAFLAKLAGGTLPELGVSGVANEKVRSLASADANRIRANFTVEQLTAGATILKAAFAAFKVEGKTAYFARNGVTAWIAAFVTPTAAPKAIAAGPVPIPACGAVGPRPFTPVPYFSYLQR